MKVDEYFPLYGLLHAFESEYKININGNEISVKELFGNFPDHELYDLQVNILNLFDLSSLCKVLNDGSITSKTVVPFLRELFDNYRNSGGDPLLWLHETFKEVNLNPHNFRKDLIGAVEKALVDWIETYERMPYNYMYHRNNSEDLQLNPNTQESKDKHLKMPNQKLSDLITHNKSHEIEECIKIQYKNIKGKRLKILLLALQDLNLIPESRIGSKFHKCCKRTFDWDIASYNAMNIYKYNCHTDKEEFERMKEHIQTIMESK